MHCDFQLPPSALDLNLDWFALELDDILKLSQELLPQPDCRVRQNGELSANGKQTIGVDDSAIGRELRLLARDVGDIRRCAGPRDVEKELLAIALYHMRFEAIHPLRDGNGRMGRMIMAMQCSLSTGFPAGQVLDAIQGSKHLYVSVFVAPISDPERYQLLVELVSQAVGYWPIPEAQISASLIPNSCRRISPQFRFGPLLAGTES